MTEEQWAILVLGVVSILSIVAVVRQRRELDLAMRWAEFWRRLAGDLMLDNAALTGEQEVRSVRVQKPDPETFPAVNVVDLKHRTVTRLWLN